MIPSILKSRDKSDINEDNRIDYHLPIYSPYWMKRNNPGSEISTKVGQPGIRATWIGHATVLAEIDEAVVLCDPIFRYSDLVFSFCICTY